MNIPYVEQGFLPNRWVDISACIEQKMQALSPFQSQLQPHPAARSLEAVRALAIWRGPRSASKRRKLS